VHKPTFDLKVEVRAAIDPDTLLEVKGALMDYSLSETRVEAVDEIARLANNT
jgi:hypothetical protein